MEVLYLNNQEVYEKLSGVDYVEGLENLLELVILEYMERMFSSWEKLSECDYESKSGSGSFQLFTTTQYVRFDCYNMNDDDMNKIIDIMLKFECPLYDSCILERFD